MTTPSNARSWAPAPAQVGAARAVATTSGTRFALHTKGGDVGFVPGINLGSTTPGHYPGEVAIEAMDYRRWFVQMGQLGIRSMRIYTIHRPAFYTELLAYNTANPDAPLYLVQGIYPPDESFTKSRNLFAAGPTSAYDAETRDAVAAVSGSLTREPLRGRAFGTWTADVRPYVMGWITGSELDPSSLHDSDARNANAPAFRGRYFTSAEGATPTERWLAARLEVLAEALTSAGAPAPLAFVNWPTTDPLRHPSEPLEAEDLVQLDANRVRPTSAWRGGYFASYHAYPYYPDFQRHEPGYQKVRYAGRADPYAGYLTALRDHHATLPTMISEFGVPSSNGSAHSGPLGRDQGDHSEQESMATDAELLRMIKSLGLAGGFVFEWTDEWFKSTWNTQPRQLPSERKALWHDPWTNEQWFGMLATDASTHSAVTKLGPDGAEDPAVEVSHDESWVHVSVRLTAPAEPLVIGIDVLPDEGEPAELPGGAEPNEGSDVVVVADAKGVRQYVRADQDGRLLDGVLNAPQQGWVLQQLTTNRPLTVPNTKRRLPAEHLPVGNLKQGDWTPGTAQSDSLAQYAFSDEGRTLSLRLPWPSLLFADPSSRSALRVQGPRRATVEEVPGMRVRVTAGGRSVGGQYIWQPWDTVSYTERLKDGADDLARAFRDTAAPK